MEQTDCWTLRNGGCGQVYRKLTVNLAVILGRLTSVLPEEMIESFFVKYGVVKKTLIIHKTILWPDNKMNLLMTNLVREKCCSIVTTS